MSSILTALKKLEQEADGNTGVSLPSGTAAPSGRVKNNMVVTGLIVFVLCALTAVGTAIFARKTSNPGGAAVVLKAEPPVASTGGPENMFDVSRGAAVQAQNKKKPVDVEPATQSAPAQTALLKPPKKRPHHQPGESSDTPATEMNTTRPDPLGHPEPPSRETALADKASDRPPDTATKTSPPAAATSGAPDILIKPEISAKQSTQSTSDFSPDVTSMKPESKSLLDQATTPPVGIIRDPDMDLQAISWSPNPDKRMAIINGKICREKDRIEKYVIVSINAGDVVVSNGSVTGRLVFEIR